MKTTNEILKEIEALREKLEFTNEKEPRSMLYGELWELQKLLIDVTLTPKEVE